MFDITVNITKSRQQHYFVKTPKFSFYENHGNLLLFLQIHQQLKHTFSSSTTEILQQL